MNKDLHFDSLCVHGGYVAEKGEPQTPPIVQSTTYRYYDTRDVADMFDLKSATHMYTRISNPTVKVLEDKMAALEGGVAATATSSGQSATLICLLTLCENGGHVLSSANIYGGTTNLVGVSFGKLGIGHTFIRQDSTADEIVAAAVPETRALLCETLGNPALSVCDFAVWSEAARRLGVPLVVDNTLATPYLCRPLAHGADIVIHSTTKYADGHATSVGGMVVDGGSFDWMRRADKYPGITQPDESYHGLVYAEAFGPAAFAVKLRGQMLRDLGCVMAPMNAFLTVNGLDTLHLRMQRHCENAQALAEMLAADERVEWVNYPGLAGGEYHALQQKYLPRGAGGVLTFGVKGGVQAGKRFIENLSMTSLAVHVGDLRTSVLHPASTTHRQLNEDAQLAAGIRPELVRVTVGIEDIQDIKQDFDVALGAAMAG